jgi:hypothetical protein
MQLKLIAAVAATVVGSQAIAKPAFEGFYGQVGIGYNDISPKADNVSATILNGPYAAQAHTRAQVPWKARMSFPGRQRLDT